MNPDDPRVPALQRLALSRERMRQHLQEASTPRQGIGGEGKPSALVGALLSIPGMGILVDAVRGWWAQHPMHMAALVATNTARSVVRPMARSNPFALVVGAVAFGGMLFWLKPWRGFLKPALLAGLLPQIVSRAVAHVPMESWLSAIVTMASQGKPARAPEDTAAAQPLQPVAPTQPGAPLAPDAAIARPPSSSSLH